MGLKQPYKKPQFLAQIAGAFLVILCCIALPARVGAFSLSDGLASIASFWQGVTCFFGVNCPAVANQIPSASNQAPNNNQSSNENTNKTIDTGNTNTNANTIDKDQASVPPTGRYAEDQPLDADANSNPNTNPTIVQNINPTKEIQTKEIQTVKTIETKINTVVADQDLRDQVTRLMRQLDSDRPSYSIGQTFTMPANIGGTTLNIGSGNFTADSSGNIATNGALTIQGNLILSNTATITANSTAAALAISNTGRGHALTADNLTLKTNTLSTATGNLILNSNTGLIEVAGSGIKLTNSVPSDTAMALYNDSGTLKWNGAALALGSSVSGTNNYIPKFTASNALGNSAIFEASGLIGIGTTAPIYPVDVSAAGGTKAFRFTNSIGSYTLDQYSLVAPSSFYIVSPITLALQAGAGDGVKFIVAASERMRINTSGYVGIGTTNPGYLLDVNGGFRVGNATSTNGIAFSPATGNVGIGSAPPSVGTRLQVSGSQYLHNGSLSLDSNYSVSWGDSQQAIHGVNDSGLKFKTGGLVKMVIDDAGYVGIGTTAPSYSLDVAGGFRVGNATSTNGIVFSPSTGKVGIGTGNPGILNGVTAAGTGIDIYSSGISTNIMDGSGASQFLFNDRSEAANSRIFRLINDTTTFQIAPMNDNLTTKANGLVMDTNGNVGVGTTAPSAMLHVGGGNTKIDSGYVYGVGGSVVEGLTYNGFAYLQGYGNIGVMLDQNNNDTATAFKIAHDNDWSSELFRIQENGNVGIGTTAPGYALDVAGSINTRGTDKIGYVVNGNYMQPHDGNYGRLGLFTGGTEKLSVALNGNIGIGTVTPLLKFDAAGSGRFTGTATSVLTGSIDPIASATVTGVGTKFLSELVVGDRITVSGTTKAVVAIASDTSLTVDSAFTDLDNDTSPDKLAAALLVRDASNVNKFMVSDQGYVGINTNYPRVSLEVGGWISANSGINTTWIGSGWYSNATNLALVAGGVSGSLLFSAGPAERMRIDSGGNVGIGTTAPGTTLHTVGANTASNWGGNTTYYGGGRQHAFSVFGDQYGSGAAYTYGVENTTNNTYKGGKAGGYFAGGNGGDYSGGGAGILAIGGNASTGGGGNAWGGAGIFARGGLNADGATRSFAGWFDVGNVIINAGSVGIGTSSPGARLQVVGTGITNSTVAMNVINASSTPLLYVRNDGNTGIGTSNPSVKLDVAGSLIARNTYTTYTPDGLYGASAWPSFVEMPNGQNNKLLFGYSDAGSGQYVPRVGFYTTNQTYQIASKSSIGLEPTTADISIRGGDNNSEYVRIKYGSGNFGIGTSAATSIFQVNQRTAGSGTVVTDGTITLTGTGTQFLNTFKVGDTITVSGETARTIATIASDTSLTVTVAFSTTASGLSYTLAGGNRLSVLGNGNVGIGTTSSSEKLQVAGAIRLTAAANDWMVGTVGLNIDGGNFGRIAAMSASGGLQFWTNAGEALRINSSGNVGIGTTVPAEKLSLYGLTGLSRSMALSNDPTYYKLLETINYNSADSYNMGFGGEVFLQYDGPLGRRATTLGFLNGTIIMNGNVGVGTASPVARFHVVGVDNLATSAALNITNASSTSALYVNNAGNVGIGTTAPAYALDVKAGGTGVIARFNSDNNTSCGISASDGTITCTSDERLKKNIEDLNYGLSEINKLRPVSFNWNSQSDNDPKSMGFLAQEVETILPRLVMIDTDGYKSLSMVGMVPMIVKSIQEQQKQIDDINLKLDYHGAIDSTTTLALGEGQENTIANLVKNALAGLGMAVENGVASLKELVVEKIATKQIEAEQLSGQQIKTRQMCVMDSNGVDICLTGDQLRELIQNSGGSMTAIKNFAPTEESASTTVETVNDADAGVATSTLEIAQ